MPDLVIDCGTAIKWYVPEPQQADARALRLAARNGLHTLYAPAFIRTEFANVMWKKCVVCGEITVADLISHRSAFHQEQVDLTPDEKLLDDAVGIALAHKRTVYDSLYIALAQRLGCKFVTTDARLVNAVQAQYPFVVMLGTPI